MSDVHIRLSAKKHIAQHLSELQCLLGRRVQADELLTFAETEELRERAKRIERTPLSRHEISFAERLGARFQTFVRRLHELHPVPVYLWTSLSNTCGLLRPVELTDINFGFDYEAIPEGILSVVGSDLTDVMLLDFSENSTNERRLEIEVSGKHWGAVEY